MLSSSKPRMHGRGASCSGCSARQPTSCSQTSYLHRRGRAVGHSRRHAAHSFAGCPSRGLQGVRRRLAGSGGHLSGALCHLLGPRGGRGALARPSLAGPARLLSAHGSRVQGFGLRAKGMRCMSAHRTQELYQQCSSYKPPPRLEGAAVPQLQRAGAHRWRRLARHPSLQHGRLQLGPLLRGAGEVQGSGPARVACTLIVPRRRGAADDSTEDRTHPACTAHDRAWHSVAGRDPHVCQASKPAPAEAPPPPCPPPRRCGGAWRPPRPPRPQRWPPQPWRPPRACCPRPCRWQPGHSSAWRMLVLAQRQRHPMPGLRASAVAAAGLGAPGTRGRVHADNRFQLARLLELAQQRAHAGVACC